MTPLCSLACALRQDIQSEVLTTQKLLPRAKKTGKCLYVGAQIQPKVTSPLEWQQAVVYWALSELKLLLDRVNYLVDCDSFYAHGNRNRSCNSDLQ